MAAKIESAQHFPEYDDIDVLDMRVLLKAVKIPKERNGIMYPDSVLEEQNRLQTYGQLVKKGPRAFKDGGEEYETLIGQWVFYSNYDRMAQIINGELHYNIKDNQIIQHISEEQMLKNIHSYKGLK